MYLGIASLTLSTVLSGSSFIFVNWKIHIYCICWFFSAYRLDYNFRYIDDFVYLFLPDLISTIYCICIYFPVHIFVFVDKRYNWSWRGEEKGHWCTSTQYIGSLLNKTMARYICLLSLTGHSRQLQILGVFSLTLYKKMQYNCLGYVICHCSEKKQRSSQKIYAVQKRHNRSCPYSIGPSEKSRYEISQSCFRAVFNWSFLQRGNNEINKQMLAESEE